MATVITKSIGTTGRDYSTLQAFFDAIPANLVTADEQWIGEVYNDGLISTTGSQSLTGKTTDATRNVILRAAAGQSFNDHANKRTNPLRVNQSNGATITITSGSSVFVLTIAANYTVVEGLQFDGDSDERAAINVTGTNCEIRDCICEGGSATSYGVVVIDGASCNVVNCVAIQLRDFGVGFVSGGNSAGFYNCTAFRASAIGPTRAGFRRNYDSPIAKNCASFNFSDGWDSGWSSSSSNNATDGSTAPGSGSLTGLTLSNQFESVATDGTHDLRVKAGAGLINAGTRDQTNTNDLDITETARSTSTPTIGAWEYGVAASSYVPPSILTPSFFGFTPGYGR